MLALMMWSVTASATPQRPLKISVVAGVEPHQINIPTIEFYRAVLEGVEGSSSWLVSPRAEVKRQLNSPAILGSLTGIPVIARKEVRLARIQLKHRSKGHGKQPHQIIAPVQAMLDTLALDGAILVDCRPQGTTAVRACGLYYYDRALGRILATAEKSFAVGISDASRWGPRLVQSLDHGLQAYVNQRERSRLDQVLAATQKSADERSEQTIELRLSGLGLADPKRQVTSLPGVALLLGHQRKGYIAGLALGYARSDAANRDAVVRLEDRVGGLFFSVQSRALESIIWEMEMGVGYSLTTARSKAYLDADASGGLETRSVRLRLGPSMMWEYSTALLCGFGLTYDRFVPMASHTSGLYRDQSLSTQAFGLGIHVRTAF